MKLVVYADFNCPYSCLASRRIDILLAGGSAEVEWRAVEHDPAIPTPSEPVDGDVRSMLDREVAEVRSLLRPGESFPIGTPPVHPNTALAVDVFAAASAERRPQLRRALFAALWFDGRDTGDPTVVGGLSDDPPASGAALAASWREEWLALDRHLVPMLVLPDGYVSRGLGALSRIADLAEA